MAGLFIRFIQKFSWVLVAVILVYGWYTPILMVATFVCMIAPIVFSFYYGRAWCGNFCPRASFSNSVLSLISFGKSIPKLLKSDTFRIITFILLMTFFTYNLINSRGTLLGIGVVFLKMLLITTIIQVSFGIFVHPNAWCSFCPMGTAAYYITKFRGRAYVNIKIDNRCVSCGICKGICPVEIDIPMYRSCGEVNNADCMKCRECVKSCPQNALTWGN